MKIGVIGAGMIGSTVGRLWVEAGHDVRFATRHPEQLAPLVASLGPRASAGTAAEAASFGDVVLLTVPLAAVPSLAQEIGDALADRIVLDTGNAYERRDGDVAREATAHPRGTAGWAAEMFPRSRWVKAFNSVYFKTLETEAHREGDRVGIPLSGDDAYALEVASQLVRDAGFEPVIAGALSRGRDFEPGTPVYNTGMTAPQLLEHLGPARARGTFEVKLAPLAAADAFPGRMSLDKQFRGDLEGTGKGEMLTAMTPVQGSAAYVAIERIEGTLAGRSGSFVVQHSGTMNRGAQQLVIRIVPDSGTGELAGISGTMRIDISGGQHSYTLEYSLE